MGFGLTVVVVLALFAWVQDRFLYSFGLPVENYAEPVLGWVFLEQVGPREWWLLALGLLPLLRWQATSWAALGEGARTYRWIVGGIGLALGWAFSAYDYNLYADQAHVLDRLFVLAAAGMLFVHPGFAAWLLDCDEAASASRPGAG